MSKTNNADVGSMAPDFSLPDGDGNTWRLADHRGKVVVLLFYPGDETPICTKQMCSVRDRWEDYAATGAAVVGVSANTVESHKSFAEHHNLPLRLLADADGAISKLYGSMSIFPGRTARCVFVIDAHGIIRHRDVRRIGFIRPSDDDTIRAIREAQSP
ncbi:MAG: thioredoxin-dependent peroxiredoxin [Blastocatellia bacterium]|jgi:peroxiredoxin Q/BCP|nr:thioredoxin-dependent peroxiredoxin [Blastocatellia bacterium]